MLLCFPDLAVPDCLKGIIKYHHTLGTLFYKAPNDQGKCQRKGFEIL